MKTIFYRIITIWSDYPFQDEIEEKYVEFYEKTKSKGSKRFQKIDNLKMDSATSIDDKKKYLSEKLNINIKKIEVKKIN